MLINATTPLGEARAELARSYDLAPSQAATRNTAGAADNTHPKRRGFRGSIGILACGKASL